MRSAYTLSSSSLRSQSLRKEKVSFSRQNSTSFSALLLLSFQMTIAIWLITSRTLMAYALSGSEMASGWTC